MALQLISEEEDTSPHGTQAAKVDAPPRADAGQSKENTIALGLLLAALKALSQRTIVALAALQVTLAIGSVLFLAYKVLLLPSPSMIQMIGVAIYATFVLLALWLARR